MADNRKPSAAYTRFIESLVIGFDQWHDGLGYDLGALEQMTVAERASIEVNLIERLSGGGDWRDVEALVALGTPAALDAVRAASKNANPEVRNYALGRLVEAQPGIGADLIQTPELEAEVVRAVERGALELAEQCPTPRVKRALLDCARTADGVTRVNAAALLMYLCGQASEPFDWNLRPFFLRFGEEDPNELQAAWTELRERTRT
jgi:hypothetical protein